MSILDIAQLGFIVVVVVIGFAGMIFVIKSDKNNK